MRLKTHREDVKDLRLMQDAHVQAIAERYRRLIFAYEELEQYRTDHGMTVRTDREKRVLKDSK